MKTLHHMRAALLFAAILSFGFAGAAITGGSIMGQVTDPDTKDPLDGALVILQSQGSELVYYTDAQGRYYASNIPAGVYTVTVSFMGKTTSLTGVKLTNDEELAVNMAFSTGIDMPTFEFTAEKGRKPLIDALNPIDHVLDRADFENSPIQTVSDIPLMLNVPQVGKNYYVRGSREGGLAWYIDGCKVTGNPNIPVAGVDIFRTYMGHIPAKYGDTTGGVVAIETRSWFTE